MGENIDIVFGKEEEMTTAFDKIVAPVAEQIAIDEAKPGIMVPGRIAQIRFCLGVMRFLTKGTDAEVSYKLNAPFKSMGSVSVVGSSLKFTDAEWFSRAAEFASNTEVYAMDDGRVKLTFTFHGLTKPM